MKLKLIQQFNLWLAELDARKRMREAVDIGPAPPISSADRECARLAFELADEAAQSEIECNTAVETLRHRQWYDTQRSDAGGDPVYFEGIDRALRYLDLRGRVFRHPVQKHLVRFER